MDTTRGECGSTRGEYGPGVDPYSPRVGLDSPRIRDPYSPRLFLKHRLSIFLMVSLYCRFVEPAIGLCYY